MKQNSKALQDELSRQMPSGLVELTYSTSTGINPDSLIGFLHRNGFACGYKMSGGHIKIKGKQLKVAAHETC